MVAKIEGSSLGIYSGCSRVVSLKEGRQCWQELFLSFGGVGAGLSVEPSVSGRGEEGWGDNAAVRVV